MKVLLTGPSGRVGFTTLIRLQDAAHQVRCFDTRNDFPSHPKGFNEAIERFLRAKGLSFEWLWGDIRNPADLNQALTDDIDVVVHHAAMTLPSHCEEEWGYCWDVNYYGTLNVLDAIERSSNSPKLIYSSSVANYGFARPDARPFVESDALPSTCTYAATKIASEIAIRRSGVNYSIMRMASALDYRAPHLVMNSLPAMLERIQKENRLKTPTSPAHWVSTDDVNTAYLNAIGNPASDRKIFNIAGPNDCRTTFKSFQDKLSVAFSAKPTTDDDWGSKPYPQFYYDIDQADSVLHFAQTSLSGLIDNMIRASSEMTEFLRYFKID